MNDSVMVMSVKWFVTNAQVSLTPAYSGSWYFKYRWPTYYLDHRTDILLVDNNSFLVADFWALSLIMWRYLTVKCTSISIIPVSSDSKMTSTSVIPACSRHKQLTDVSYYVLIQTSRFPTRFSRRFWTQCNTLLMIFLRCSGKIQPKRKYLFK